MVAEFEKFFDNSKLKYKSYLLRGDNEKIAQVKNLLEKHEIVSYSPKERVLKALDYGSNNVKSIKTSINDLVIPTNQPKGKMVKVLFELEAKLSTPITYDITAWNVALAYGLQGFSSEYEIEKNENSKGKNQYIKNIGDKNAYAYINKWNEISDAELLGDLIAQKFNVRFSYKDFSVDGTNFKKGSLIVMRGENEHIANFDEIIVETANKLNKKLAPVSTGFSESGPDFGSANMSLIKTKNVALLSGEGTSSLGFGEIWHFFETQLNFPINVINTSDLNSTNLSKYEVLILPNGYTADENSLKKLDAYALQGGTIVSIGSSVNSFADKEGFGLKKKKNDANEEDKDKEPKGNLVPFDQRENENIKEEITGSIFKSTIDASHPLAFGYSNEYYSLKLGSSSYQLLEKGYNFGYFPDGSSNISGYAGEKALELIPNSLLFGVERKGRGQVIYMVDNPLFRSFWENGKLFLANAVFLN
jgi:DNA-directed RNA polymerase subunit H (RpoH/RPB5)